MPSKPLSDRHLALIVDRVASIALSGDLVSHGADLRLEGAKAIDEYLAQAFEAAMLPLVADLDEVQPSTSGPLLSILVREVARLKADIFALKQSALGNRAQAGFFRDPLAAIVTAHPAASKDFSLGLTFTLHLHDRVLGHGWYVEPRPDGTTWRWMGPHNTATLVLPTWGDGSYLFTAEVRAIIPSQLAGIAVSVNDKAVSVAVRPLNDLTANIEFSASVESSTNSFIFLKLEVPQTASPLLETGGEDTRSLGLGLDRVLITRTPNPAVAP
jgi:hypothetical protein